MIGFRYRPIPFLRGRDGHGVIPLLVAKGYELLDVRRGRKQSLGKETGEWGDRWVRRRGKTALPPPGGGGPTSGTLAAVSPTPNRPRTISQRAQNTRAGRSAQCQQSDSSSAASAWARPRPRQATQ